MDRRTLTMNWDGLAEDDDDDDNFFESRDRLSTAIPLDLGSSGSDDDDEFEDGRLSFVSTLSSASIKKFQGIEVEAVSDSFASMDYGMWMAEPGDIKERRKRLLQGMGLSSNKDLLKLKSAKILRAISRKVGKSQDSRPPKANLCPAKGLNQEQQPSASQPIALVRSRSDGDIQYFSVNTKKRKEELIGDISKQHLTRTFSGVLAPSIGTFQLAGSVRMSPKKNRSGSSKQNGSDMSSTLSNGSPDVGFASFFLIKNLDTGKEFIVKESNEQGMWNKLSDIQTGKQLTMDEFEKHVGYSPVVKELMRRVNGSRNHDDERKLNANSYISKSFRNSKRRGVALLKNIKGVAHSMSGRIIDKEREKLMPEEHQKPNKNSSKWIKVRQHWKSYKEFTALHLCQEIHAHEGSIWTIRFSLDAHYLATAGEDTLIHIWEVQECEVTNNLNSVGSTMAGAASASPIHPTAGSLSASPVHPIARTNSERPPLPDTGHMTSERRKKGKVSHKKKGNSVPEYVNVPETVFALSEKPVCTLKGHQDDVLDLSWSRSQLLLSSSIDKTVRLWDIETQSCLKMFAHNDYVTCIQINPMDDDYFISGSLDAKVRIWNIPDRKVVDWTDLHEMVTATCFTPDGQGALIGSHKGSCRMYNTSECKLEQKDNIEIQPKKNSQLKKVTGLQFAPWNPAEVLITSADSRIRIFDGAEMIYKFRGFRNTSSQIAASFSSDGKYVISASEDSHVYIWKREEPKSPSGKPRTSISVQAHERFQCKDVSVAIPWPGSVKNEPPLVQMHSKRHSKRFLPTPYPTVGSPTKENSDVANSRRHLPPLPNKNNALERIQSSREEEDLAQLSRTDSGIGHGESFASGSSSTRFGDSPSISASSSSRSHSWSSSWSQDGSNSHGSNVIQATAWGMVIVTASLGGEIRVYQNFGLPLKAGRQTNLFRDLT